MINQSKLNDSDYDLDTLYTTIAKQILVHERNGKGSQRNVSGLTRGRIFINKICFGLKEASAKGPVYRV